MPNDCQNDVTITFKTKEEKEKFIKKYIINDVFDFNTVIPEPKTKEECDEKYYINKKSRVEILEDRPWFNWHDWHCDFWNTKWNSYECVIITDEELRIYI